MARPSVITDTAERVTAGATIAARGASDRNVEAVGASAIAPGDAAAGATGTSTHVDCALQSLSVRSAYCRISRPRRTVSTTA